MAKTSTPVRRPTPPRPDRRQAILRLNRKRRLARIAATPPPEEEEGGDE